MAHAQYTLTTSEKCERVEGRGAVPRPLWAGSEKRCYRPVGWIGRKFPTSHLVHRLGRGVNAPRPAPFHQLGFARLDERSAPNNRRRTAARAPSFAPSVRSKSGARCARPSAPYKRSGGGGPRSGGCGQSPLSTGPARRATHRVAPTACDPRPRVARAPRTNATPSLSRSGGRRS